MAVEVAPGTILARGFDWDEVRFPPRAVGEFVTLRYGKGLQEAKRRSGSVPVFGTNGQCGWHDEPLAQGPGVILGRKGQGHLGVKWCRAPFWVIDTAYYADLDQTQADLRWFYFLTEHVGLDHLKTGEKPGLPRELFCRQLFPFPPLHEQKAIAGILGVLDDKIELNRRMNHTLETLARALFKSWFVDFDPVVAKAAAKRPVGMSRKTAALFPDRFQDSELGPIPKGWDARSIDKICSIHRAQIQPSNSPTDVFAHYSIPAFDNQRIASIEAGSQIKSGKFLVPDGCVLLSKLNPHEPRVWMPDDATECQRICSTEFIVCRPRDSVPRSYLFAALSDDGFMTDFATLVTGTSNSHQRVKPDDYLRMMLVLPSNELLASFNRLAAPLFTRADRNRRHSTALRTLRDALLPRLMSGELRVRQAEKLVEANL